jgi:hypothetical protein
MNWEYARVVRLLRRPDARLVLEDTHHRNRVSGRMFFVLPTGTPVSDETAQAILLRVDVHLFDAGLFEGHPQSWRLGRQS